MQNLDPHSVYIPSDQAEDVENSMRGDFVGIGIRFFVNQDSISVLRAIENGPSDKAGIKGGDKILYADGKPLFGINAVSTNAHSVASNSGSATFCDDMTTTSCTFNHFEAGRSTYSLSKR